MGVLKGVGKSWILATAVLFVAVALALVTSNWSVASAGGGTKVTEAGFGISVEPIEMTANITDGRLWNMRPGDRAMLEVVLTNHSQSTDWKVQVEMQIGPTTDVAYAGPVVTTHGRWDDAIIFRSGDVIVVPAGTKKALAIVVTAMDGAGQADIRISVYRVGLAIAELG